MKIITLEYNANAPTPKQVSVPLYSDYTLGVKVTKDGQPLDLTGESGLSVGGIATEPGRGGYNIANLSSDGHEGIKSMTVDACRKPTANFSVSKTDLTAQNPIPTQSSVNLTASLSDIIEPGTEVRLDWLKPLTDSITLSSASGVVTGELHKLNSHNNARLYFNGSQDSMNYVEWLSTKKWYFGAGVSGDHGVATNKVAFKMSVKAPPTSNVSGDFDLVYDSGDGYDGKFELQVSQKNLGFLNVESGSEPSPVTDPASITDGTYSISADGSCVYLSSDYAWNVTLDSTTHQLSGTRDDSEWIEDDVKWRVFWFEEDEENKYWLFKIYTWNGEDWVNDYTYYDYGSGHDATRLSFDEDYATAQRIEIPGQGPASGTVATKEWVRQQLGQ